MVLESLGPGAPVNVRTLTIENPRDQNPVKFDLERDVPPAIKGAIIRVARREFNNLSSSVGLESLAISKLLYPNELKDITVPEDLIQDLIPRVWPDPFSMWQSIRTLNLSYSSPFSNSELVAHAQEAILLVEEGLGPRNRSLDDHTIFLNGTFTTLQMLAPGKIANLKPSPRFLSQVNEYFATRRTQNNAGAAMARVGANLRILFWPGHSPYVPAGKDWGKMQSELQDFWHAAGRDSSDFNQVYFPIRMAMNMQILAADELHITENGVEPIFYDKQSFQAEAPPLPEARRF